MPTPHIPVLRLGKPYVSLDTTDVVHHATGEKLIAVSQVNAGIVRRDLPKYAAARDTLRKYSSEQLLAICRKAAELFLSADLPLCEGVTQSADDYVRKLSASSGLPEVMVRRNMTKVAYVLGEMRTILNGLTRNMDLGALDAGSRLSLSFYPVATALGVVLPSNSPGVNSLWIPSIALKIPVVLKPGREEPWTPYRIIQALITAGAPAEAFGFYPTDHEGAAEIINSCGRALLFGDENTTARWKNNPGVQIHGPGRSKVLIGDDCIENWRSHLDIIAHSIAENGGRSCVNASAVIVPRHGREIAAALAQKLGPIEGKDSADESAQLSAFANTKMADWIDTTIEEGLQTSGAEDVTAKFRTGPRKQVRNGATYMRPTIIFCENFEHPLANKEFLCPYASVVEMPQREMLPKIGHSLVVTAITEDAPFIEALQASPLIDRLNIGPVSTMKVAWDQPHEGNLFEFLYRRRAIVYAEPAAPAAPVVGRASLPAGETAVPADQLPLDSTKPFSFQPRTRLVFGAGALEQLPQLVKEYGGKRVLLVTDAGIVRAGHAGRAQDLLTRAGLGVALFDGVQENPTTKCVTACVAVARANDIDFIVGLGGGSSLDTAKGANFIYTNGGTMADYWGANKAKRPMLPMIAVPTTAGTGSECQGYALVADENTHQKMACGDEKAYPRVALLDPLLTVSMPRQVTANTGIDTIAHALEAHVCTARSDASELYSREAWRLANAALEIVLREPANIVARGRMLLASAYAGIAIAQSMLGAAHSAANPLTAHYNVVHGQAVGVMLPHVIRFNAGDAQARALYAELAAATGLPGGADGLVTRVEALLAAAQIPPGLAAHGVKSDAIASLADEAEKQWTAQFNPRKPSSADFAALYKSALNGATPGMCC